MRPHKFLVLLESGIPLIGSKTRTETFVDQCCPHCSYVFPEKGGPWPKDRAQLKNKTPWHEVTWVCPQCNGEMHYPESKGCSFFESSAQ